MDTFVEKPRLRSLLDHFFVIADQREPWRGSLTRYAKSCCWAALADSGLDWRLLNKSDGWIPFARHAQLFESRCVMAMYWRIWASLLRRSRPALRNMARYSRVF